MVEQLERNDFQAVSAMMQQLRLDQEVLFTSHLEAIQWTNNLSEIE